MHTMKDCGFRREGGQGVDTYVDVDVLMFPKRRKRDIRKARPVYLPQCHSGSHQLRAVIGQVRRMWGRPDPPLT